MHLANYIFYACKDFQRQMPFGSFLLLDHLMLAITLPVA